jgi:hypothetical protein
VRSSFPRSKTCSARCLPSDVRVMSRGKVLVYKRRVAAPTAELTKSLVRVCALPPGMLSFPRPADLTLANDRCATIEMEVRQEVSEEMATQLAELEQRYRSMHAQESTAAEVHTIVHPPVERKLLCGFVSTPQRVVPHAAPLFVLAYLAAID